MATKLFVSLYDKTVDGSAEHLGGKGAGLHWMASQGLPIPPAMILPTTVCAQYRKSPAATMKAIRKELKDVMAFFSSKLGHVPLVSVRSGARVSMPGMMDTILNVGLDDNSFAFWADALGEDCVSNSAARLVEMYGSVVKGIDRHEFAGLPMEECIAVYTNKVGEEFPDAEDQLMGSIEAVFNSWDNERAKVYRQLNNIPDDWGTAVVVQSMVFGNLNDQSCTGVLFTRNPDSGAPGVLGEFLINAQGEDVVAGIRTPDPLVEMGKWNPEVYGTLLETVQQLEDARKDIQDVEFTVQGGQLFILQTRNAKRSGRAAVRAAVDFHIEGLPLKEALSRVTAKQFDLAQQSVIDPSFKTEPDFTGIPACSGVVTGVVVTSAAAAINCTEPCILVTQETTPDDIAGMNAAIGVLTMTGGATSHAAVVARGMNKPCVVGLGKTLAEFPEWSKVSIDGATGRVWRAAVPVVKGDKSPYVAKLRKLMWDYVQCNPIALDHVSHGSALIRMPDLLYIPTIKAGEKIVDLLCVTADTLTLDLTGHVTPHEYSFFRAFQGKGGSAQPEAAEALVKWLEKNLGEAGKAKLVLLYSAKTSLKKSPTATCLEDLVLAEPNSTLVWAGQDSEAVKKVLVWKASEGVKLASYGVATPGGYITERQLIAELLS